MALSIYPVDAQGAASQAESLSPLPDAEYAALAAREYGVVECCVRRRPFPGRGCSSRRKRFPTRHGLLVILGLFPVTLYAFGVLVALCMPSIPWVQTVAYAGPRGAFTQRTVTEYDLVGGASVTACPYPLPSSCEDDDEGPGCCVHSHEAVASRALTYYAAGVNLPAARGYVVARAASAAAAAGLAILLVAARLLPTLHLLPPGTQRAAGGVACGRPVSPQRAGRATVWTVVRLTIVLVGAGVGAITTHMVVDDAVMGPLLAAGAVVLQPDGDDSALPPPGGPDTLVMYVGGFPLSVAGTALPCFAAAFFIAAALVSPEWRKGTRAAWYAARAAREAEAAGGYAAGGYAAGGGGYVGAGGPAAGGARAAPAAPAGYPPASFAYDAYGRPLAVPVAFVVPIGPPPPAAMTVYAPPMQPAPAPGEAGAQGVPPAPSAGKAPSSW